jgi:phosphoglycerate kinase
LTCPFAYLTILLSYLLSLQIGSSLFDKDGAEIVKDLVAKAKAKNVELHFPVDYVAGNKFAADATTKIVDDAEGIPDGWMGLDCGPKSNEINRKAILEAKTILWNGPAGVFEFEAFANGTKAALDAVIEATENVRPEPFLYKTCYLVTMVGD